MKHKESKERYQQIVKQLQARVPIGEICKEFGVGEGIIYGASKKSGIGVYRPKKDGGFSPTERTMKVAKMLLGGAMQIRIAEEVGLTRARVNQIHTAMVRLQMYGGGA